MRDILKQIWRFLRIAASGPGSLVSLLFVGIVAACELAGIQITLRLIQWSADFYNALQKLDAPAAINQIGVFAMLIGTSAMLFLIGQYLRKIVQLRWRRRLTDVLLASWTANQAYWILDPSLGSSRAVDNPDQRISEDANIFVASMLGGEGVRTGVLDFTMKLIGLFSYATLLWQLSTFDLSFGLFGLDVVIPKYMFWVAPLYVVIATFLTHVLGRELPGLLAEEQKREADFRFALMRIRENSSAIALSGGEAAERRILSARFESIVDIWRRVIRREFIYGLFQRPYFQTVLRIPMFLALPAFLAGKVTLGGLMQLASAFQNVVTTLSWFIFNYKFVSDLVATTRRLARFHNSTEDVSTSGPARSISTDGALRVANLAICTPDNRLLLEIGDLTIARGQTVWLSGVSGLGKSTLFKALAGMWPHASGTIETPQGRICFLPQQVYLPLDSLAAAAIYPALPDTLSRSETDALLTRVGLGHRLGAETDATNGLSVGEQQRLALARVLASKPDWVFLDEATSALDLDSERRLMTLLQAELPHATFVVVAHREPQGLRDVVRIELSRGSADNITSSAGNLVQGNLAVRMG
jgi:vitamin B12/bleomycin/antimicrobial peptide transport system ATP-binding/permease protein